MKGPHICDCLCALCEHLGTGAFGPQPDGTPGVVVIRRRRVRRFWLRSSTPLRLARREVTRSL